jgi:hypothetical protein
MSRPTLWPPAITASRIRYRVAQPSDAVALAPKLRPADVAEMALMWSGSPEARLAESIRVSDEAWAAIVDEEVEAVFGLVRYSMAHVPWMRCSAAVGKHTSTLLADASAWLANVRSLEVPLANTVASNNAEAISMLKHLGFVIGDTVPNLGPEGSFRYFFMEPRNV